MAVSAGAGMGAEVGRGVAVGAAIAESVGTSATVGLGAGVAVDAGLAVGAGTAAGAEGEGVVAAAGRTAVEWAGEGGILALFSVGFGPRTADSSTDTTSGAFVRGA